MFEFYIKNGPNKTLIMKFTVATSMYNQCTLMYNMIKRCPRGFLNGKFLVISLILSISNHYAVFWQIMCRNIGISDTAKQA